MERGDRVPLPRTALPQCRARTRTRSSTYASSPAAASWSMYPSSHSASMRSSSAAYPCAPAGWGLLTCSRDHRGPRADTNLPYGRGDRARWTRVVVFIAPATPSPNSRRLTTAVASQTPAIRLSATPAQAARASQRRPGVRRRVLRPRCRVQASARHSRSGSHAQRHGLRAQ